MDKEDDPFFNLLKIIRDEGIKNMPFSFFLGKVTNDNPLAVKIGDIELEREDMLINTSLLKDTSKVVKIEAEKVAGHVQTDRSGTLNTFSMAKGKVTSLESDFLVGEQVLLLRDKEQWILICKVR